jgi:hypothetical protein
VKLDQDDVTRICQRVVDHELNTQFVAYQFEISRRRVQQLAQTYRETDEIPELETPGRKPYAEYPTGLDDRILKIHERLGMGAVAVAHVLRVRDDLTIDNNVVHEILKEHDNMTKNPRKQGRRHPWVRCEREHSLVTVHLDWYYNEADQWCLAVFDDASRKLLGMIEKGSRSAERSVDLVEEVRADYASTGLILEGITDHGSEFYAPTETTKTRQATPSRSIWPPTRSSTRCVRLVGHSPTGRSSGSSRRTTSSAGDSERSISSANSTIRNDHT